MTDTTYPEVLVVGGGSVGLSAALLLAHHGVSTLVVERRDGVSVHPRATGIGPRTLEFFREVGCFDALAAQAVDMGGRNLGKVYGTTLVDTDLTATSQAATPPITAKFDDISPCKLPGTLAQDRIDAVLLAEATRRGARVLYGSTVVGVVQDDEGVTATLDSGETVRTRYLIAADGVRSGVREQLGIGVTGPGPLGAPMTSTLFRADLTPYTKGAWFATINLGDGMLVTIDGSRDWIFHTPDLELTPAQAAARIRAAVGDDSLEPEVRSILQWRPRGQLADRFAVGRVFLVGDAARAVPPLGGFGLNTGIADAHNLAWKLALVLRGAAGPGLLDTYETERRPVAAWTLDQALLRGEHPTLHWMSGPEGDRARAAVGMAHGVVVHVGYRYDSTAIVGSKARPSDHDIRANLDGSPGSRLPHLWVAEGVSTLDLIGSRFTLLGGDAWLGAADALGLNAHVVEGLVADGSALLVRPDGFICWRGDDVEDLEAALDQVLQRTYSRA